jgi:hypothetical protein
MITPVVDPATAMAVVTIAGTVLGLLRVWLGQRAQARHDAEVTRRLELLITHTPAGGQAAAVRAWVALEAACHGRDADICQHNPVPVTPNRPQ